MRGFAVLSAAAALLAGCGQGEADQGAGAAVAPPGAPAIRTAAGEPPAPAAKATTIPGRLLGVYDVSLDACGKPGDGRLTVTSTELRFHESIGTVREVIPAGSDSVTVEADYQGEGERWRSLRRLELGDGGATLTVGGDGTRLVRVRCPEGKL